MIEAVDSKTWKIHGNAPLEEVAKALGTALPCEEYDTFNGLVFGALGAIPQDGSTAEVETAVVCLVDDYNGNGCPSEISTHCTD